MDNPIMRDPEMWLCEFSKIVKLSKAMKTGKQVKHRKYNGDHS